MKKMLLVLGFGLSLAACEHDSNYNPASAVATATAQVDAVNTAFNQATLDPNELAEVQPKVVALRGQLGTMKLSYDRAVVQNFATIIARDSADLLQKIELYSNN